MGMKQVIKNLDAFPRAEDHLLKKTQSGALVSVIGLIIMATLFVHELGYYLKTYTIHQMSVDLKRGETLPIHINMTFPALPCDVLSVDAIDMSGKHEVDLDTNIWKRKRLILLHCVVEVFYCSCLIVLSFSGAEIAAVWQFAVLEVTTPTSISSSPSTECRSLLASPSFGITVLSAVLGFFLANLLLFCDLSISLCNRLDAFALPSVLSFNS
ncbi:unnamed protein product [Sphenostylis stenocarpa]|uniref:Endoplasmic reticulum vesicle transporter N-terminal domain-containing protein n=1 Tax=Sphenostylis stenocarpa TaxID=92480 RepID=A0AA86SQK8_9FABA|nr:unnamed protein product [Sphenostylis stenocarpa]